MSWGFPGPSSIYLDKGMHSERLKSLYQKAMTEAASRYDADVGLVASGTMSEGDGQIFRPAASLPYAYALMEQGDTKSVKIARRILDAVLESQERSPTNPHHGNFKWLAGDSHVADLNAVQFVIRGLMPLLLSYDERLGTNRLARLRAAVRDALSEIERLNVHPDYTNIHLLSLFGLLMGAQWLQDDHFNQVAIERWNAFAATIYRTGAPHEYNSSNYGAVDLLALGAISTLADDARIRLEAELLHERFWLHLGLHLHKFTGQLAGPHCRAYWYPMVEGHSMLGDLVWVASGLERFTVIGDDGLPRIESLYALELLQSHIEAPEYLFPWLGQQETLEVRESTNAADLTTFMTPEYALGTASRTYSIGTDCYYIEHQANYLLLHYTRPGKARDWGLVYSRFVVNDRHWGTVGAAPDRPTTANFYDHGHFAGIQLRNKAIALYCLMPEEEEIHSVKTVVAFQEGDTLEGIWVNQTRIDQDDPLPSLEIGDWLIVEDGDVYVGVLALEPSDLGSGAGLKLESGPLGELWLSIMNYEGPAKRFWEYASLGGAFWRGNLKAGYVLEVVSRSDYPSAPDFYKHLQSATITESLPEDGVRAVQYQRAGEQLQLNFDLMNSRLAGRWINGEEYQPPVLLSPLAVQGVGGILRVGGAVLKTAPQPAWLIAAEPVAGTRRWIAVNPTGRTTKLDMETPLGRLTANTWGSGRIEWCSSEDGSQQIKCTGLEKPGGIVAPDGVKLVFITFGAVREDSN